MIDKIKSKIRQIIRSEPNIYKIFLYFKNGYTYKLPNKNTDIHLTGYQRSGNTFATKIIENIFSEYTFVTHFHSISSIKSAFNYDVPVIVLIRNPVDSVLSSVVKRIDGRDENLRTAITYDLDEYYQYYSYVLKHHDKIKIFHFLDLKNNPEKLIKLVADQLNIKTLDDSQINNAVKLSYENLNDDKRKDGDRNMPSQYKENKKKELLKYVKDNEMMNKCEQVYKSLLGKSV